MVVTRSPPKQRMGDQPLSNASTPREAAAPGVLTRTMRAAMDAAPTTATATVSASVSPEATAPLAAQQPGPDCERLQQQVDALQQENASLRRQVADQQHSMTGLQQKVTELELLCPPV